MMIKQGLPAVTPTVFSIWDYFMTMVSYLVFLPQCSTLLSPELQRQIEAVRSVPGAGSRWGPRSRAGSPDRSPRSAPSRGPSACPPRCACRPWRCRSCRWPQTPGWWGTALASAQRPPSLCFAPRRWWCFSEKTKKNETPCDLQFTTFRPGSIMHTFDLPMASQSY